MSWSRRPIELSFRGRRCHNRSAKALGCHRILGGGWGRRQRGNTGGTRLRRLDLVRAGSYWRDGERSEVNEAPNATPRNGSPIYLRAVRPARRLRGWTNTGWAVTRKWAVLSARRSRGWARQAYVRSPRIAVAALVGSVACLALVVIWLSGSLGQGSSGRSSATGGDAKVSWFPSYTVTASQPQIDVHSSPGGPTVQTLNSPLPEGTPLTLLMTPTDSQPGGSWIQVFLPTKPNGSTGWIQVSDVSIQGDPYQLALSVSQRQLKVYKFGRLQDTYHIAVGAADTPTPWGPTTSPSYSGRPTPGSTETTPTGSLVTRRRSNPSRASTLRSDCTAPVTPRALARASATVA